MTGETSLVVVEHDGAFEAHCEIVHPMTDDDYLTQLVFRVNDQIHSEFLIGKHVSSNPVFGISLNGLSAGTRIEARWQDIKGRTGNASYVIAGAS